jgi:type I restriction enzyme, S subunit
MNVIPTAGLKTPLHKNEWQTKRLKYLFRKLNRPVEDSDNVVTAFRDGVVTLRSNRREDGFTFADKEIGYQGVEPYDLVIHAMDGFAGAIGVSDSRGKCSPVYSIAVPITQNKVYSKFWGYYLRNLAVSGFIESLAKGIRERSTDFRWKDVGNLLVNFPCYEPQKEIADFLDRETARIDQLIEKKKQLVLKIKLREVSFIEDCLTGRDVPNAERRETFVPWLGAIPAHWRTTKLRHLVRISTGGRDTKDRVDNGDYPFFVRSMKIERIDSFSMNEEAVLTSGDGAGVGEVFHHIFGKFDLHQRMYAFTKFRDVSGDYFYYFLRAFFKLQMSQWSAKSTVDSVRMPFLKTMVFTVPPRGEQAVIAERIKTKSEKYQELIERTENSIKLLKQFRTALITEAVTGQLDIQAWKKKGGTDKRLDNIETAMVDSNLKRGTAC